MQARAGWFILLAALLIWAQPQSADAEEKKKAAPSLEEQAKKPPSLAEVRSQGLHYLRRKMYPAARRQFELALTLKGGDKDFRTHNALAKLYYDTLVLEKAFPLAFQALELAKTDRELELAKRLTDRLAKFFAGVKLVQARPQQGKVKQGIIHLEDRGGLINVKKKKQFQHIKEHFAKTEVSLPLTIYLPFGKYAANLAPFAIIKGKKTEAVTFLDSADKEQLSMWWIVGGGVAAAAVATVAVILFYPEEEARPVELGDVLLVPRDSSP